jgi:hypothetical protein
MGQPGEKGFHYVFIIHAALRRVLILMSLYVMGLP